jgi:hypothetical protein
MLLSQPLIPLPVPKTALIVLFSHSSAGVVHINNPFHMHVNNSPSTLASIPPTVLKTLIMLMTILIVQIIIRYIKIIRGCWS